MKNLATYAICTCLYVNISFYNKTRRSFLNIGRNKNFKVKLEIENLTRWLVKLKIFNSQKLLLVLGGEKNVSGM